jgi:hypothetical protein
MERGSRERAWDKKELEMVQHSSAVSTKLGKQQGNLDWRLGFAGISEVRGPCSHRVVCSKCNGLGYVHLRQL